MQNDFDSFSVCFNVMKIKYAMYDNSLDSLNFLEPTDKVNIFINLETILRLISSIKDVDRKIYSCNDFNENIISNIVNLAAHYRKFFRGNGLDTRIYLYMTDFTETKFNECSINPDFRSYYSVKYTRNPRYTEMGDKLTSVIIPHAKEICNYIKGVYFITTKGFDSSLVPLIIGNKDTSRKNLVITGEYIDTQYSLIPNYVCHYFRRSPIKSSITCDLKGHLTSLLNKQNCDYTDELNLYSNKSFYMLLFSVLGEGYRSIEKIPGIGNITLLKMLIQGLKDQKITLNTTNINTIAEVFPEEIREDVIDNFKCLDMETMYQNLTLDQLNSIDLQLIDKFDHNGLLRLNSTRFINHRFMLEELTI